MPVILRIDDCGWKPEDKTNDVGLTYFQKWRDALGSAGYPIVYGFIPTTLRQTETEWLQANLRGDEEVAIHGWDHAAGAVVDQAQMRMGLHKLAGLKCQSYIPPFNAYSKQTQQDWHSVMQDGVFFGGLSPDPDETNALYEYPCVQNGGVYIKAFTPAYKHIVDLNGIPEKYADTKTVLVFTLHATWDVNHLGALRPFFDKIKAHLVPPTAIKKWLRMSKLSREALTGGHYMAYTLLLENIAPGYDVLDFGARYSSLPGQMTLRGANVLCCDRDPKLMEYQRKEFAHFYLPAPTTVLQWDGLSPYPQPDAAKFDMITACWSIQHNIEDGQITAITKALVDRLKPEGKLCIVGSYTPTQKYTQLDRADPQIVLDMEGYRREIIDPSGCTLQTFQTFYYEHNTPKGQLCDSGEAKAAYLVLRKPK